MTFIYNINKCHFDKDCRNVKRINENQYINKDTNIKCKYLHSGETIENYNYRISKIRWCSKKCIYAYPYIKNKTINEFDF